MGYEAMREQTLARQKEMGIVPADTELPPLNPIGTPADPHRPGRPAVPAAGLHQAVGHPVRGREAAVRPDGRGVCRVPGPRRPPHRPAAGLPGGDRAAREHAGHRRLGQRAPAARAARTGRSTRTSCSTASPTTCSGNLAMIDELGGPTTYNHYPQRLGDGVQHAVQDVEALRVQRRHLRPVHHLLARGLRPRRRDPPPVPPRHRPRAHDPGPAGRRRRRRRSRATPRARSTA